ncbi:MAG: single-stranded-DNA-specific exonuclease RecJ [Slackia faecicanis]|nr:single-stranded-DNA-specific exonuclease RecJ [Slackia faecicanis]
MAAQFHVASADPTLVSAFQQEFGLPRFVARTMAAHGISSVEEARAFLAPDLERDWRNPYEIPDMKEAADRIEAAIREGRRILVFGDFDLDGISATTVLTRGLRALGADAVPLIPKRFEEGYGLTAASIARAESHEPSLIVTVDCGISCKDEVNAVLADGIDVVVTDHHEPGASVPEGVPVADPKCDPACESSILAGVGVALKMVQALGGRLGQPHLWREYTDFATLGTVADLMPLRGENRALVADGIARMNANPRPCIAALIGVCNVAGKPLSSTNLSFSLIPRLNAAGRMGNADLALELLMADDFETAQVKATELDLVNDARRAIEADLAEEAKGKADEIYTGQRALVVAGEGWHEGVKGIVASRLVNAYGVPSLLFTIEDGEARGSGRSVGRVNLFKAVESASDILTRFGGHEAAVGVTLPADKLPEFAERLCAYMDTLPEDSFHPLIEVDSLVDLGELTLENVDALASLAPFGQENLTPRYLARNIRLSNCRAVGAGKNHLACTLTDGASSVDAIMFHCDGIGEFMACGSVVDAAFQVQVDEWRGRRTVKCMLDVVEPASACPALKACLPVEDMEFIDDLCCEDREPCVDGPCCCEAQKRERREHWETLAANDPEGLTDALVEAVIGVGPLHDAQRRALDCLARGKNTLAVMGTGRGKSLVFHVHAARCALAAGLVSVFVYPLRALISDQAYHLATLFSNFGLTAAVLTGETSFDERVDVYGGLADGSIDVLLTTPEYLAWHANDIAACGRIGFLAVDEAHHMAQAGSGKRAAYDRLRDIAALMGGPVVLAATATAPDEAASCISDVLGIDEVVYDAADRGNLQVDDRRSLRDKDSYLASIVASGEKTIVYVNSRMGSVDLTRSLRRMVPQIAMQIGFYNAGLSREERTRIERLFRENVLRVLVCTSAFGEGVDIPDVRHVVLYGMPFSEVEFNQMSGRAGRNGREACIHLLFGSRDAAANQDVLRQAAPEHDALGQVYRELRCLQRDAESRAAACAESVRGEDIFFTMSDEELARVCNARTPRFSVTPDVCASGMAVFEELGLVRTRAGSMQGGPIREVHVCAFGGKVELTDSVRYREGLDESESFARFTEWVMRTPASVLRDRIIRPIAPAGVSGEGDSHAR